jgi:hypothetical protein
VAVERWMRVHPNQKIMKEISEHGDKKARKHAVRDISRKEKVKGRGHHAYPEDNLAITWFSISRSSAESFFIG